MINVLNKRPSRGKNHEGLSPDQLFNQECAEVIKVESDAFLTAKIVDWQELNLLHQLMHLSHKLN